MISTFNQSQNNINTSNYYVKVTNMGAYLGFYYLFYLVNDKFLGFQSPLLPVLQSHTITVPDNATDIFIQVNVYVSFNLYKVTAEFSFDKPSKICLTSYGTIFKAWVYKTPC